VAHDVSREPINVKDNPEIADHPAAAGAPAGEPSKATAP
jgi:hypothetical protein